MKKLQNNFTTPEQSKRLLALGVPADSADCYYAPFTRGVRVRHEPYELRSTFFGEYPFNPCWSAGQLVQIYELCTAKEFVRDVGTPLMEDILSAIYNAVNDTTEQWDFSKLED